MTTDGPSAARQPLARMMASLVAGPRSGDGCRAQANRDQEAVVVGIGHPASAAVLVHVPPVDADRQLILRFAGNGAGLAAVARACVKVEG